uniref:Uncharacterized protein n=1 Tax=Glossina pallidipes TaxID=7398 RepID=A0A1A9ZBY7_GLOPL
MFIKFLALVREELGELAKRYQWCLLGGLEGLQAYRQWNTNYIANHEAIPSKEFIQCHVTLLFLSCQDMMRHIWLTARMDANAEKLILLSLLSKKSIRKKKKNGKERLDLKNFASYTVVFINGLFCQMVDVLWHHAPNIRNLLLLLFAVHNHALPYPLKTFPIRYIVYSINLYFKY